MSKKNILLLTENFSSINNKYSYLSIVPLLQDKKKLFKIREVNFLVPQKSKVVQNYNFCNKIYKNILKKIIKIFNKVHNVNFNEMQLEIVLGHWLQKYIYLSFKFLDQLEFILKKEKVDYIQMTKYKNFNFIRENTADFCSAQSLDIYWYYCYFSKIYDYFIKDNHKNIVIKKNQLIKDYDSKKIIIEDLKLVDKIISLTNNFRDNKNAFISHSYLPFLEEKKLEVKFNQTPSYYKIFKTKLDTKINFSLRQKYSRLIKPNGSKFENFVISNFFFFLPKSYFENFNYNLKLSKSNFFPSNPKFIFTSSLHIDDEVFKIYVARQFNNNKPIFIGQHGNNYFSHISHYFLREINYATKFFSWGYSNSKLKNVIGLFNFKSLNKPINKKINSKKKIVIYFDFLSAIDDNLFYSSNEITKSLLRMKIFFKGLKKEIKDNIILRLNVDFFKRIYGVNYSEYFNDLEVQIDNGTKHQKELLKDAKICVFNYDSTGFLENICQNIPSIMLLGQKYLNFIHKDFVYRYKILEKEKIIFFDEMLLSDHLNQIWDDLQGWWDSKKVQNSLKKFNYKFNIRSNKESLSLIKKIIKKNI